MMTFAKLSANTWNTSFGSHRKDHKCSKTARLQDIFKYAYSWKLSFVSCKKQVPGGSIPKMSSKRKWLWGVTTDHCSQAELIWASSHEMHPWSSVWNFGQILIYLFVPKILRRLLYYRLLYTHCQQLLKSVNSHGSFVTAICDEGEGLTLCELVS